MTSRPLRLTAPIEIEAAAGDARPRRLNILAYNGGVNRPDGFPLCLFDLKGMEVPPSLPILMDHRNEVMFVAGTGKPIKSERELRVEGTLAATTEAGKLVLQLHTDRVPLQASVGLESGFQYRQIRAGEKVRANGREFTAPAEGFWHITKCQLREVSIVAIAADADTAVVIARKGKESPMEPEEIIPEETTPPNPPPQDAGLSAALELAARRETARREDVTSRLAKYVAQCPALLDRFETIGQHALQAGWDGNRCELELLRASRPSPPAIGGGRTSAPTAAHLSAALMVRAGFEKAAEQAHGQRVMEESRRLHARSLVDLCRAAIDIDGRDAPRYRDGMIRAALSTGSMPIALGDSANKILVAAYRQAPASWRSFAAVKSAADFKDQTGIRPTFAGDLEEVGSGGEIKHGSYAEETYQWSVDTFGKQFQIDRRDIIDDDAGVFTDVVPSLARAAARSLNDLVARTLLKNAGSFFSATNKNYFDGAATNLQASSLATAIQKLRQMKDAEGNLLDLEPRVLLVPPELEVTGRELLESMEVNRDGSADRQPLGNVFKDVAQLAVEPRLSDSNYTGYSATAWYLFSDAMNAAVVVGFLDGQQSPTVETFGLNADINHLAFGFRIYHDFGCALADFRAAIKSKGAA
jgi:hypothetical protein